MTRLMMLLFLVGCNVGGKDSMGGQSGEEGAGAFCGPIATTELADDETSVLGFGRTEVATISEGVHSGTLTYADGTTTPLTVTVTLGAARYHDMDWVSDDSGTLATPATEMGCADVVEVDATIEFVTEDGAFVETWDTTLQASSPDSASFYVDLDLDALGGSFVLVTDETYDAVDADAMGSFDTSGAHGELSGMGEKSYGTGPDGAVSATNIPIASW